MQRRLLCVDDEEVIRITMSAILEKHGFEVSTAASVPEALQKIMSEKFDVLLSDLNIGNPGDGLTVVSAMRRTQPEAVTMILTGYPAFETALEAIRQQVDEYIVKPADVPALLRAIESKLAAPLHQRSLPPPKRVAMILQENLERIETLWLSFVDKDKVLRRGNSMREKRLGYVHETLLQVVRMAQVYSGETTAEHLRPGSGRSTRDLRGFTPCMVVAEFCLLRRAVAQIVQENLLAVNLSYLVPDLARVNEILDEQVQAALETLPEGTALAGK
ncbi:MAG TPA: response regulator [Acidobacteriaceae bacterium]|nr:response regulator [Acidobacteriaceae bacterium]